MPNETYPWKKILWVGLLLIVLAGVAGFFVMKRMEPVAVDESSTFWDKLFPFGQSNPNQPVIKPPVIDPEPIIPTPVEESPVGGIINISDPQVLRQIAEYPITNFIPWTGTETVSETKLDEKTGQPVTISRTVPMNFIRWNIKQSGILMDAEITKQAIIAMQKTTTIIPVAQELWFADKGNSVAYRTWNDSNQSIDTYHGSVPQPLPPPDYCIASFTLELKQGAKGAEVATLQKYINAKLAVSLVTDGSFGKKTAENVAAVQKMIAVPETGIVDIVTRDAINADCAKIRTAYQEEQSKPKALVRNTFLPSNIIRGAVSSNNTQLFYLTKNTVGVTGTIASPDGSSPKKIFESPFTEWMPLWPNANTIALTTAASREASGYLYFLDPTSGVFKKILGPARGLTTNISPDAQNVLYSTSSDTGLGTSIYNTQTGASKGLGLTTLPAKCVWQNATIIICGVPKTIESASYPDAWYQGIISFDDAIWSINIVTGTTKLLHTPDEPLDVTKPQVSPDGNYFYFINRTDETLWSLRLGEI